MGSGTGFSRLEIVTFFAMPKNKQKEKNKKTTTTNHPLHPLATCP